MIDALASPRQGERSSGPSARVTDQPVTLAGAHPPSPRPSLRRRRVPAGRRQGDRPSRPAVLAAEGGEDALIADWVRVVGLDAMRGFEFADMPDRPVTAADTLRLGGRDHRDHPSRGGTLRGRPAGLAAEGAGAVRGRRAGRGRGDDGGGRKRGRAAAGASTWMDSLRPRRGRARPRRDSTTARRRWWRGPASTHRPRRPTCARRWRRACRCAGRSRPCRRRTTTVRSR